MKLTIFAATGGIGRQLLGQAVAAGHDVTAVARNPRNLSATPARVLVADLAAADAAALTPAVEGADAVLSALGARTKADTGVATRGTRAITEAMRASGVRRIIVVSAAPIGTVPSPGRPHPPRHDPGDGLVIRYLGDPVIKRMFRAHYADLAQMEDILRDSDLDWTVVRPPRLTGKPVTGRYRTAYGQNIRGGAFVSRADVAHYMLRALDQPETFRQTVGIANSAARLREIFRSRRPASPLSCGSSLPGTLPAQLSTSRFLRRSERIPTVGRYSASAPRVPCARMCPAERADDRFAKLHFSKLYFCNERIPVQEGRAREA